MLSRVLIGFNALVFLGFGGYFLFALPSAAEMMGVSGISANGWTDLRATYGGAMFGFGVWLSWCFFRKEWFTHALLVITIVLAGFMLGRVVGLVSTDGATFSQYAILGSEIVLVPLCFFVWRRECGKSTEG